MLKRLPAADVWEFAENYRTEITKYGRRRANARAIENAYLLLEFLHDPTGALAGPEPI